MLRKRPEDRYQTAAELAQRLAEVLGSPTSVAGTPPVSMDTALTAAVPAALAAATQTSDTSRTLAWTQPRRRRSLYCCRRGLPATCLVGRGLVLLVTGDWQPSTASPVPRERLPPPRASELRAGTTDAGVDSARGTLCRPAAGTGRGAGPALRPASRDVQCLAWHPGGDWLASGHADHGIRLWQFTTAGPAQPVVLIGHTERVQVLDFDRAGKTLASGGWEGTVRIWDVTPDWRDRAPCLFVHRR